MAIAERKKNLFYIYIFRILYIPIINGIEFFENMVGICFNHFVDFNRMVR
jgi:hypothetical protein